MSAHSIRLHASQTTIDRQQVYFAFESGRFAYDCVSCASKCCRGFSYLTTVGPELGRQLQMRRALPVFLGLPEGNNSLQRNVGNYAPGCFFLAADGRCEIHAQHGFEAKPETCRLFPFNNFRQIGNYLIVGPHPSLCPLDIRPTGQESETSSHDMLFEAMSSSGIAAPVQKSIVVGLEVGTAIRLERDVQAMSGRFMQSPDYAEFVLEQLRILNDVAGPRICADVSEQAPRIVARTTCDLLGVPDTALGEDQNLIRTMVASTPFLRARLLFVDAALVRTTPRIPLKPSRIPLAILVLYVVAEAARLAGMKRLTFQSLSKLQQDFSLIAALLCMVDCVVVWHTRAPVELADIRDRALRMAILRVARAVLPASQKQRSVRLGDLLLECAPSDPVARAAFVREAAKQFAGRLIEHDAHPERQLRHAATIRQRVGFGLQRLLLRTASDELLGSFYDRLSAARAKAVQTTAAPVVV